MHIDQHVNEIQDRCEQREVLLPKTPIPRQAVSQKRPMCCFEEPSPLCFALHLRTKRLRIHHAADDRTHQLFRLPALANLRLVGARGRRFRRQKRCLFSQRRDVFGIAKTAWQGGMRIVLVKLVRHPQETGVLRLTPGRFVHPRTAVHLPRANSSPIALHHRQFRRRLDDGRQERRILVPQGDQFLTDLQTHPLDNSA